MEAGPNSTVERQKERSRSIPEVDPANTDFTRREQIKKIRVIGKILKPGRFTQLARSIEYAAEHLGSLLGAVPLVQPSMLRISLKGTSGYHT